MKPTSPSTSSFAFAGRTASTDGSRTRAVAVRDGEGRIAKWFGTSTDVEAQKEAEEALRTSEERFRTAAENLTDVVYDWDIKEKVDWYGDIDGIMGYPPGGFPRTIKGWAATIHPEDKDRVMAALEGHLKGVAPYIIEYRVGRRDGEWRWWSARGTALRDDRGEPYKMIGSITDITERKRADAELQIKNHVFDESIVAQSITDSVATITHVNPELLRMWGYPTEEQVIGNRVDTFFADPSDAVPILATLAAQGAGRASSGRNGPTVRPSSRAATYRACSTPKTISSVTSPPTWT